MLREEKPKTDLDTSHIGFLGWTQWCLCPIWSGRQISAACPAGVLFWRAAHLVDASFQLVSDWWSSLFREHHLRINETWSFFTFVFIRSHSSTETLLSHLAAEVRAGTPPPVRAFVSAASILQVLDLIKLIVYGLCSVYSYLRKTVSVCLIRLKCWN